MRTIRRRVPGVGVCFAHYPLSGFGQSKFLFMMEKQRLSRLGVPFVSWQNRWIRGYFMALPTVFLFWFVGGWLGIVVFGGGMGDVEF